MDNEHSYDPDWSEQDAETPDEFESEPTDDELNAIEQEEEDEFQESMGEILSQYEAEQDEFNEAEAEFLDKYGFEHKCHCAEDWAQGNLGVVSVCYLNMVSDAMDTLEKTQEELKRANRSVAALRIDLANRTI